MAFSPLSFAIGVGAAYLTPVLSRTLRPFLVEATALGLGLFEDLRRVAAEQLENIEDIAAEARARREARSTIDAEAEEDLAHDTDDSADADDESLATPPTNGARVRRRPASRGRSQPA